jgi:two-component system sensor histidine kinase TtrS
MKSATGLFCLLLSFTANLHASELLAQVPEVTIGLLAHRGDDAGRKKWTSTTVYLGDAIPDRRFRLIPLDLNEMDQALAANRLDLILTNPGNYVELEDRYGISRIATLKNMRHGKSYKVFGAVIFTRSDRKDIKTLADLRGQTFAAVAREAFGGFQMAWRELREINIDPFTDLADLRFTGFPQDYIVEMVLSGKVTAGTVRTNVLETMAEQHLVDLADIRILNPQQSDDFPFRHSTRLYPEWAFAKSRYTSDELAKQIVVALLRLSSDHPAVQAGNYSGWTVPLSYQPVHELFRELEIGPYQRSTELTLAAAIQKYWYWIVVVCVIILSSLFHLISVERKVIARTRQLTETNRALENEISERKKTEREIQTLFNENRFLVQKYMAVQEDERRHLARELHDELGQCIAAIQAEAENIQNLSRKRDERLMTSATAVQDISSRIYDVVHSMIQRLRPSVLDELGLVDALKEEIRQWQARYPLVAYTFHTGKDLEDFGERVSISIYRIVQECLTNVAKHADANHVLVDLRLVNQGESGKLHLIVQDDGVGMDGATQGCGLGMIGIRERVEALNGDSSVQSSPGSGTRIIITVPVRSNGLDR